MAGNMTSGVSSLYEMTSRLKQDPKYRERKRQECKAMLSFHAGRNPSGEAQWQKTLDIIDKIDAADDHCLACPKFTYYGKTCEGICDQED